MWEIADNRSSSVITLKLDESQSPVKSNRLASSDGVVGLSAGEVCRWLLARSARGRQASILKNTHRTQYSASQPVRKTGPSWKQPFLVQPVLTSERMAVPKAKSAARDRGWEPIFSNLLERGTNTEFRNCLASLDLLCFPLLLFLIISTREVWELNQEGRQKRREIPIDGLAQGIQSLPKQTSHSTVLGQSSTSFKLTNPALGEENFQSLL